jgi:hypothetical protein
MKLHLSSEIMFQWVRLKVQKLYIQVHITLEFHLKLRNLEVIILDTMVIMQKQLSNQCPRQLFTRIAKLVFRVHSFHLWTDKSLENQISDSLDTSNAVNRPQLADKLQLGQYKNLLIKFLSKTYENSFFIVTTNLNMPYKINIFMRKWLLILIYQEIYCRISKYFCTNKGNVKKLILPMAILTLIFKYDFGVRTVIIKKKNSSDFI